MKVGKSATHFDPIFETSELLGDAWSWMILREAIFGGASRFGEFQESLAISPKILTARLSTLSSAGLFERHEVRGRGAPVEYRLTEMGEDFSSCLLSAMDWGARWMRTNSPLRPRTHVTHNNCRHRFVPEFRCACCKKPIRSRDVRVVWMHRASSDLIGTKRQRRPDLEAIDPLESCPIAYTLRVIGDRWSSLLIRECFLGTKRFGEFQEHLGIAPNILSGRLNRLIDLGILVAAPASVQGVRNLYRLTEKGHDLYSVPLALLTWGERWLGQGEKKTELVHKPCGQRLKAIFSCGKCGSEVGVPDLRFHQPGSSKPA